MNKEGSLTKKQLSQMDEMIDNLRNELKDERQEVLKMMDIIHFYEALATSLKIQQEMEMGDLDINEAIDVAERVTKADLQYLYSIQKTVSSPDPELSLVKDNAILH